MMAIAGPESSSRAGVRHRQATCFARHTAADQSAFVVVCPAADSTSGCSPCSARGAPASRMAGGAAEWRRCAPGDTESPSSAASTSARFGRPGAATVPIEPRHPAVTPFWKLRRDCAAETSIETAFVQDWRVAGLVAVNSGRSYWGRPSPSLFQERPREGAAVVMAHPSGGRQKKDGTRSDLPDWATSGAVAAAALDRSVASRIDAVLATQDSRPLVVLEEALPHAHRDSSSVSSGD